MRAAASCVMDFGLARTVEGDGMTQTGALVGTMEYMSPEQALAKRLDQRSDLFTAGLILYELSDRARRPSRRRRALASLIKRTQERAMPVSITTERSRSRSAISSANAWSAIRILRYQTAEEVLRDLDAWQGKGAAATWVFIRGRSHGDRPFPGRS